jgi:hypothetical protein
MSKYLNFDGWFWEKIKKASKTKAKKQKTIQFV